MIQKYAAYLEHTHRLQDRFIPHYLRWVKSAYVYTESPLNKPLNDEAKIAYCLENKFVHDLYTIPATDS